MGKNLCGYTDAELVAAYIRHRSQYPAAEELGVSRETVARAVRRAGIPMTGKQGGWKRKKADNSGTPPKITNEELAEEAKTLTCVEIAAKHRMSPSRVYKRAKKLGIKLPNRAGGHWSRRARFYGSTETYDDAITLEAVSERFGGICQICGELVDWSDKGGRHIRRMYPTVDHIIPLSKGGSHTWENVQLAHMHCNSQKHDKVGERKVSA